MGVTWVPENRPCVFVCFAISSSVFLPPRLFLRVHTSKTGNSGKRKRRAPQNDNGPSNESFFNNRKESKYEKHIIWKEINGYLWKVITHVAVHVGQLMHAANQRVHGGLSSLAR